MIRNAKISGVGWGSSIAPMTTRLQIHQIRNPVWKCPALPNILPTVDQCKRHNFILAHARVSGYHIMLCDALVQNISNLVEMRWYAGQAHSDHTALSAQLQRGSSGPCLPREHLTRQPQPMCLVHQEYCPPILGRRRISRCRFLL